MHRSGTSLISAFIQSMGVFIGDDLIGAAPSNELGHFEDKEFTFLNEEILARAGGNWKNIPPLSRIEQSFIRHLPEVKRLIEKHKRDVWGWKDPRNSILFPFYVNVVDNPHLVICWRNPVSVAMSLNKRDKIPVVDALKLICVYYKHITDGLSALHKEIPWCMINYEKIIERDKQQLEKLKEFIGLNKDPDLSLIKPELRHF